MRIKSGMAGSNGGRSRWEPTEILKSRSKCERRRLDRFAVAEQLAAAIIPDINDDQEHDENRFSHSWSDEDERRHG